LRFNILATPFAAALLAAVQELQAEKARPDG